MDRKKGGGKDKDKKSPNKKPSLIKRLTKKRHSKKFSKAKAASEPQATNAVLSRPSTPPPEPVVEGGEASNVATREALQSSLLAKYQAIHDGEEALCLLLYLASYIAMCPLHTVTSYYTKELTNFVLNAFTNCFFAHLFYMYIVFTTDSSSCGRSMRSFSSQEDLFDNNLYSDGVELDKSSSEFGSDLPEALPPEAVDQPPGLDPYLGDHEPAIEDQPHHQHELLVHTNEVDVTIMNYDADIESDNEQDDSEHDETILDDPAKVDPSPLYEDPSPDEILPNEDPSVAVVLNQDELDHVIAVPSNEVEERVSEPEVYVTPPEAIVEEVEAVQVETAVEPQGGKSTVSEIIRVCVCVRAGVHACVCVCEGLIWNPIFMFIFETDLE